jgi:3-oxoacyl-[acyl-carrier-protein] synthase-3
MNRHPVITGTGSYAPENVLTNDDLEEMVDTSDEWIRTRTGIEERRIADEDQASSDLGVEAAREALDDADMTPEDVDLIIVATATPDMNFPSTGCVIQNKLGAGSCAAFDLSAACSGYIYGLSVAHSQVMAGVADNVLVIGTETLSKITNWDDRTTCVLFGDGAGAFVLENKPDAETGGLDSIYIKADGQYKDILSVPAGGSACPVSEQVIEEGRHYLQMDGPAVFKVAVRKMKKAAARAVERAGLTSDDVDWVICHQANLRIIDAVQKRLEVPDEKMIVNLQKYGNTSAASIGLAFDEARKDGRIQSGDKVLMVAFGGGLTWASGVVTMP